MSTVLERSRTREMSGPMGQNWRAIGLCRGSDTLTFYPPSDDDSLAEEAKTICSGCAVRRPCLEFALTTREKHGPGAEPDQRGVRVDGPELAGHRAV